MEYTSCLVCGADEPEYFCSGYDRFLGTDGEFTLVRCARCGFVYLNPRPAENEMSKYYTGEYYSFQRWSEDVGLLKRLFRKMKWKSLSRIGPIRFAGVPKFIENGRILDFGCGSGEVLNVLKRLGWETYGIEIDTEAAEYARSKGLRVFDQDIRSIHFPDEYFDVVRMRSVLEHCHRASPFLDEVFRVLKKTGSLILVIPNIKSLEFKIFKNRWFHLDIPRHLYHFTPSTITSLLEKHGFQVPLVRFVGGGGILGSLDYILNENKNRYGTKLNKIKPLRTVSFFVCEFWINLFRQGDMIEVLALKP
jgi:SAM-dependent methyltransferase